MIEYSLTSLIWLTVFGLGLAGTSAVLAWIFLPDSINLSKISKALARGPSIKNKNNPSTQNKNVTAKVLRAEFAQQIYGGQTGPKQSSSQDLWGSTLLILRIADQLDIVDQFFRVRGKDIEIWGDELTGRLWGPNLREPTLRRQRQAATGLAQRQTRKSH